MSNDKRRKVYDVLVSETGYKDGFDEFNRFMDDESKRKKVYDVLKAQTGYADDYKTFESLVGGGGHEGGNVGGVGSVGKVGAVGNVGNEGDVRPQQPTVQIPSVVDFVEKNKFKPMPMLETEAYIDENGDRATRVKRVPGFDNQGHIAPEGVYRDMLTGETYDPTDPNTQQVVEQTNQRMSMPTPIDLERSNREQVASLTKNIDDALKEAKGQSIQQYYDRTTKAADKGFFASLQEAMMMTAGAADPTDMQRQSRNWIQRSEGVPTEEGMALNRRINDLETAQRTMRNAQRIIDEADHNAQGGTFGKWLESSFAGGAARGFGQKLFDIDTWDMGLSDMQDATGLLSALQAFDSGKELTESQKILLDAKAVELATNAYFGSYVGRGYKAGQVTAESIPFMIEMCLNPAAGTGNAAENMLARYAIKRFGKDTVKRNAKKYVASKVGARVTGDIVGSATMAATTGAIGVTADAIDRSNGHVQFDTDEEGNSIFAGHSEGDDFGTAFGKAFAARTIENYSEMFGEYFAPVLEPVAGAIGKGFTKAAGSKVGSKLGLESVNDFMQNVAASDVAKIVTDFEKHARWNGVFGEYAEEVAGGIMNALVVGDQTLDTNPDTGVFNLDNNIDTFLGVSLMGGFMSAVKTAGYRTPKYRARQDMKAKDDAAAAVFGNQDTWGDIRNTLAFGEDADVRQKLAEVLSNPDINPVQRAAVLEYAQAVETYRGMLQGENKKREDEDADPVQTDAETSFDNGYSLESDQEKNDAKNMYEYQRQHISDFATDEMLANLDNDPVGALNAILGSDAWTDEEKQTATDYVNAKATYDGMISHVQEDIDSRIHASDLLIDGRVNPTDGMIHPATMKMDDRKVYVVGGNIVMNDEGTMIDNEKSDESVIIRDAETGNMEFADPRDVLSVDETLDAAQVKQEAQEAIRMEYAQQAANSIDGVLPFYDNDTYTAIDEQGQQHSITVVPNGTVNSQGQILQAGEGEVLVSVDGAEPAPMSRAAIQDMVDNTNLVRLRDYETERAARREAQAEAEREASRPVYNLNDVVTLQTDEGPVRGSITAEENEDGLIEVYTERPVGGKKINLYNRDQLDSMLVEQNGTEVVPATTDVVPGETADNNSGQNTPPTGNIATENISSSDMEQQAMPMVGEGEDAEPDFSKATPQRAHAYIYNEAGLDREEANQFVEANKKAADKALTNIQGKKPKMGTSLAKYRKETAEWQQKVSEALTQANYWKQVKDEQQKILAVEAQARAERDAVIHEQAIAEEQQRQEEELRKREAQTQLGSNNVAPQISEKWNVAPKVDGVRNEIVLANGERVSGHYVLVESGAATPSHNPATGFAKNEGFPMDENEQSVNDRDYERDQDAQAITRQIADQYDSRAMQTPVVVSSDGVVLSGNGRTMAGELAAQNGTDGAYIEYLKKYGGQYGFTPEQVDGMAHPRVLFVPDEAMPYTADTFAKFNQQEMKGQSKTEQAVKLGKIVDNDTFGRIIRSINAYDTLSDFYADPTASANAIQELAKAGAISQAQYAEMFDGDTISSQGREMLENMLIGKAFESNPDAVREITAYKGVRQSIICALAEISNNLMLGKEYSLESELAQAIELVYQARYNGYKAGERVSSFARQLNLFPFDEGESVADYTNAAVMMLADVLNDNRVTRLKKVLTIYNHHAQDSANGQMDLFTGDVESKEEILNTVKSLLNNGTEEEQQSAIDAAVEQRTAAATAGTTAEQSEGTEQAGTTGNVDKGGEVAPTGESVGTTEASIASAEAETEKNPTEAQKEAGNYKKGHVKIDGFDISIENPKGSERSGTDASGKPWSVTMNNTYGYIRRTEGVDGDHIDVFLSDHIEDWNGMVYVVDQVNTDGSFDEHKVMYGFNSEEEARAAYLSNYSEGWQGLGAITGVSKDEFKKWIDSSHRKTKAFAEYKSVKAEPSEKGYSVTPLPYTTKRGKVLNMQLVKFGRELSKDEQKLANSLARKMKGWWSREDGGFLLRSEEDAESFANTVQNPEALEDEQPMSLADVAAATDIAQIGNENANIENVENPDAVSAESEQQQATGEETTTRKSKWVDDEDAARFEELKRRMKMKMRGQMNMGIDPEILAIGTEMAFYVIKHGARQFGNYVSAMIDELGDTIRPYLKSFYNGARDFPEMETYAEEMTPYDEVRTFDVANFDKAQPDAMGTAEQVVAEQEVEKQEVEAVSKIKEIAQKGRKKPKKQKNNVSSHQETDLFGSFSEENNVEPLNNSNNGLQRNDAVRSEGLSADNNHRGEQIRRMGETPRQESIRTDRGGQESRGGGLRPDVHDGLRLDDQLERPSTPKNTRNNHAERGTDYAPKAVDARIQANIKAIELMQQLMETGEKATAGQMAVLRQFSGWGGLGKAFENDRATYNGRPVSQYLKELLGNEAYQQANMSRNSAYYTPANVIDTLWDIAKAMGFKGGNVLEGSAGIGNILGLMPTDISERSDIQAVEIDSTTGNILSLLYPDAQVDVQGFEATQVENGSVDLAITNVPFVTGLRVNDSTGDKDLSRKFRDIHDFCIAKNIRKLRDGGIGIFITSSGTLDNSTRLREWIVGEGGADVVGAFRLNNETFGGTGATSDIIVVRKRVNGLPSPHAIDVSHTTGERVAEYDTGETKKVKGVETPIIKRLSMDYNQYFVEHPEMMAGEMRFGFEKGDTFRPTSKALYPVRGKNQGEMLSQWANSFTEKEWEASSAERSDKPAEVYENLGDGVKEGSLVVDGNGVLCIAQRGKAVPLAVNTNKVKGHSKAECFQSYKAIKDALSDVLEYQTTHEDYAGLQPLLDRLNKAFDSFVNTYGHLHKNPSISFLKNDVDFANILALEKFSERADVSGKRIQEYGKTDIFSRRVVEREKAPEPKNVKDGIIASLYIHGRIDVPYISEQLNMPENDVKAEIIKSGLGFENPVNRQMEVSYEYLSGNVREKLQQAIDNNQDGKYNANIKALEKVIPMNIPAHLIDFSIGSSWIDPKLYEEYVKEKTDVEVTFTPAGGTWFMKAPHFVGEQKNRAMGVKSNMFNRTIMGTQLIEAAMQNRTITISETHKKWDGSTETITDKEATQACANKIDEIRQDFKEWARAKMQSDPSMSEHIEQIYNEMFNNYVPKSIPDEFVPQHFSGQVTELDGKPFSLRPHQGKAVVRGTTQPLLLAHEVGTGKTFTLISIAMEMRRLGTARKPMIVVQNATVGQFVESAKAIYPNAKVLTLEDKDHTGEGRKNFYAKIKYNDWDMIVVPQSVFERIPDSEERQMNFVQDKIDEKMLVLEQMKEADPDGESIIVRQAEKEIAKLEDELATLTGTISDRRKERDEKKEAVTRQNAEVKALEMLDRNVDDVEDFDDMGIDAILVDEAHEYKHLGFATAMQRGVKGVDPSYSKKAQGVYLKAQAVLEKNHGRNVIFATGTPISNTAAEIWTFMRYLMPADTMKEYDIYYFDDFVRNFGNLTQMLEFTTSGKFRENNRFAGYVNLPELVRIWSAVADTVLTREAGEVKDKIPNMESGKAQDIYLPQTRALRSVMKYVKKQLNDYDKMSGKQKKENSHIPLTMYNIAKAAAVDARLVVTDAADEPQSKTNEAVRQTLRSLEETASYKGTVAIFADSFQNSRSGFNLYEDIRKKLIAEGVPEEQIVVMKSGMKVKKKLEIFDKVNRGEVRVIMGSTFTLGTGLNIQERLHTLIHLDAPNRPMDYTQRNGRILRQGNLHKQMDSPVRVLRFGVEDSLDVTAYQRLKTKGAIADSIMNGKQMMQNSMENRALEEEEDVFGDTVAQLSGSEYAMLKNQAEKDVRKYTSKKKQWEDDQTYCHNEIPRLEGQIEETQKLLEKNRKSLATVEALPEEKPITIGKQTFTTIESMADFLKDYNKKIKEVENELRDNPSMKEQERRLTVNVGGIDFAFKTVLNIETRQDQGTLFSAVHRKMTYSCEALGLEDVPVKQSLLREGIEDIVANVVTGNDFRERIERLENSQEKAEKTLSQVRERDGKPFEFEKELEQAKERFEEYSELMKKELEEKEAKYAEMDSEVEELDSDEITVAEEASEEEEDNEERLREGDDVETMSYEESLSSARRAGYTKKQHDAMLSRQWRRMREHAENAISRLGLIGRVTVLETAEGLKGRKAKAKGWYDAKTGKIVVVMSNHHSTSDIVRTILHEGVAHYGLRALFGRNFDQFLDNVFQYADTDVRRRIVDLAKKHGWNFRVATEEYLAGLAEDTDFERATRQGWWSKIKSFFLDMLRSIGLGNYGGAILTDNELRYILWRSYENLAEPGRYRNPFRVADDISKQMQLKVGSFDRERARIHRLGRIDSSSHVINQSVVADTGVRFRDGDFSERDRVTARDAYERMVSSGLYQFREAVQDSMLGLRKLYGAILQKGKNFRIEEVDGYENAYLAENRMSSKNSSEQHDYYNHFMRPLLEAIGKIAGSKKGARQALTDYMMAKHGLERNLVFAERDAREAEANGADYADAYAQYREKDYSGLTALTGEKDLATAEAKAQQMVDDYEAAYDTADLWSLTREATQATLEKIYKSGLLNRERYESIRDMFQYYIPLQGWDETTSDEVYGYLTSKNGLLTGSPIKHAAGRSSKADDPIATIAMIADAAISQGNRNQMKQRFLNFALNHPSDLISVHDLWLQYDAVTDEWVPVFADLEEGDTAADVAHKVEAFEQRMEQLAEAEPDKYKRGRDTQNIPYKVVRNNLKEHQVLVKRDGRTYVLTINGNPRAAQALNGLTNPDVEQGGVVGNLLKAGEYVNRQLSAFYTTRNPDFVVSNFFRDMLYSNCMTWVKENPRYALRYHKNFGRLNPVTMRRLLGKWENGNLDMSNKTEQLFYQFMINGGETGYTSVRDIEAHKQAIAAELKKQGSVSRRAWSALGMQLDLLNRSVENCARFAAFVTSREMGRSIDRSIYDAKEVSVNFNKKGSGGKMVNATGQTFLGKVGSYVGGGGRLAYVFWNAGIQGLTNFGRAGKRHGAKAFAGASAMFILGYLIPQLAAAMGGGDGDDDDKNAYYNLPEYVRRSNICFRVGDQWVTIPLPIEFRALYGLGELATGVISGNEHYSNQELSYQIASQVSQILPLDMLEGGGGVSPFIPSTAKPFAEAYIMNKGWTGLPIYKDTPWNQNDPEWTKAYKNADQTLVGASKWLNEGTGGDDFKKGAVDINPSKIEYLLSGMFGGYATTTEKLKKMGETALGNREFDWRNMLIANRVIKTGDERTANRKLQNEYFKYKKEYDETKRLLNKYENAADEGIAGMAEKANFLYNSPAYLRYELFDEYQDDINDYRDYLQETTDAEELKAIEDEMYATMRELVNLLHKTE